MAKKQSGKRKPVEESEDVLSGSEDMEASGDLMGSEDLAGSDSQADTDDAPPPEGTEESAALKAGKKSGKRTGFGKSASGDLGKKAGKTTGRAKAVSGRRSGQVPAARPRTSGHELVPVICSECYEEFMFDTGVKSDSLTCPVCEHVAGRPDDAALHHIAERRRQEKGAFMLAAVFVGVGLLGFFAWAVLMHDPGNHADSTKFWGPLGVSILSALLLMVFGVKYENSRWETYF